MKTWLVTFTDKFNGVVVKVKLQDEDKSYAKARAIGRIAYNESRYDVKIKKVNK